MNVKDRIAAKTAVYLYDRGMAVQVNHMRAWAGCADHSETNATTYREVIGWTLGGEPNCANGRTPYCNESWRWFGMDNQFAAAALL